MDIVCLHRIVVYNYMNTRCLQFLAIPVCFICSGWVIVAVTDSKMSG